MPESQRVIPNPATEPTITVDRAAAVLGLGRASAYEAIRRGEIPARHFGNRIVVPTGALLRLLDDEPPKGSDG